MPAINSGFVAQSAARHRAELTAQQCQIPASRSGVDPDGSIRAVMEQSTWDGTVHLGWNGPPGELRSEPGGSHRSTRRPVQRSLQTVVSMNQLDAHEVRMADDAAARHGPPFTG